MTLENLLRTGQLRAHAADEREILRLLESAQLALLLFHRLPVLQSSRATFPLGIPVLRSRLMLKNLFNEKKAAQSAAYLLFRAGNPMSVLKLTKLLYLAERLSFQKYGEPMIGDNPVSMPHGPVLSTTYDHMNGALRSAEGGWESWIADREGHMVDLRDRQAANLPDRLLELSEADVEVLEETWKQFGGMDQWELRDWTHANCPEWHDPQGSSSPIPPEELLAALKFSHEQSEAILARMRETDALSGALAGTDRKR